MPRLDQYFRNRPDLQAPYTYAATMVRDKKCAEVGLWLEDNSWEYPLWFLLNAGGTDSMRVEHVHVSNESSRASLCGGANSFVPCALVVVATIEDPGQILEAPGQLTEADRTYSRIWSNSAMALPPLLRTKYRRVAVYELEKNQT